MVGSELQRATVWLTAMATDIPRPVYEDSHPGVSWWAIAALVVVLTVAAVAALVSRIRRR